MNWDKLKQIRELKGLSQGDASDISGLKQKDISLLETGKKKFIPEEYILFLYNLGVDINSLYIDNIPIVWRENIHDINADTPISTVEKIQLKKVSSMIAPPLTGGIDAKNTKNASPTIGKNASPTASPTLNFGMPHVVTVDIKGRENVILVPIRARAGYLSGYGDPEFIQSLPAYNLPGLRNGTFRAFEADGHSMSPTLKNHDIVIGEWVDSIDHITDDRIYIIVTKTKGIVVKRVLNRVSKYGFLVCKSDSITNRSEYPNLQVYPDEIKELWYARMKLSSDFSAPTDAWQRLNDLEATFEHFKNELKMLKG